MSEPTPAAPPPPPAAPSRPDPIWEAVQMEGEPPESQARRAILHVLHRIRTEPEIAWEMGLGSQSFALLTEAAATLTAKPVRETRDHFRPPVSFQRGRADAQRLDWLDERLRAMPGEYLALIGLPSSIADLRDAIDRVRRREGGQS